MTVPVPTVSQLYAQAARRMPTAYHPTLPLVASASATLRKVAVAVDAWAASATPSLAEGEWLDLIARAYSIYRRAGESNADLRLRVANLPRRVTPAAIKEAVDAILSPDECIVAEHWQTRIYCDDSDTEYLTDFYCDEDHLLGVHNGLTVVCPAGLTEATELAVCAVINLARAAGIRAWAMFEDDFSPIMGAVLEEP